MTKKIIFSILFFCLLQFACENNKQQQSGIDFKHPKLIEVQIYKVPPGKMAIPKVIPVSGVKKIIAGKPKAIQLKSNVFPAKPERIILAGTPKPFIPGADGFKSPRVVPAKDIPFRAGSPEVVVLKDIYIKEDNPESFASIKAMHGLKSNQISSLCQDKAGNLWIGMWDGGISKYDGRTLTNYSKEQGLCSDVVSCLFTDKGGNIWIGTPNAGVNKFDGKFITRYSTAEGLSSNDVLRIIQDKNGDIWIATMNGLNRYNGHSFTHYTTEHGLPSNHVYGILEDSKGNLWVSAKGGLCRFDGHSFQIFTSGLGLSETTEVASIVEDSRGDLWFGSHAGLLKYDGLYFSHFTTKSGLSANKISKIIEDKNGHLWIGTWDNGVNRYDGESFTYLGIEQGLSNEMVSAVLQDNRGTIWLGTSAGLRKYDGKLFSHIVPDRGIIKETIRCIAADKNGNIWAGTWGNGVSEFNGKSFAYFTTAQGLINNYICAILADRSGNIWFGTFGGLAKYDGASFTNYSTIHGLVDSVVYCMLEDKKGDFWFGTRRGLSRFNGVSFTNYLPDQGLSGEQIFCIFEDHKGTLWFGTGNNGVCTFDGVSFTRYDMAHSLNNASIYGITEDKHNNMWFCTSRGLYKFNGKYFTSYTTEQGLSNNIVMNILKDKNENIWVGTINGMNRLLSQASAPGTGSSFFKKYGISEGFLGIGTSENSITQDSNGNIWIGTPDRLTSYHPAGDIPDSIPPVIHLTGIDLFDEKINWPELEKKKDSVLILSNGTELKHYSFNGLTPWYNQPENLQLVYNNNHITFQFVGITTNRPKEVRYQYFMEGLDENWSTISSLPQATYNNLPSGNFTFKVKAVNSEGYCSNELSYPFTILPPWWKTWWFRVIAVCCVLGIFYGVIRLSLQQKFRLQLERSEKETQLAEMGMKTAELQQQATELEMQALRAQMNPHFIFNCLSSINRFILKNESETASDYLTKFSRLIRMVLNNSKKTLIILEDELEMLRLYLDLERLRFKNSFDYSISFYNHFDISSIFIPPLLLQPFAENAIWHGLMNKEGRGNLEIAFELENNMLNCYITDNGVGRKKAETLKSKSAEKQKSMGMQITAERLALFNKEVEQTIFSVEDLVDAEGQAAGTRVTLKIRYKESIEEFS